MFAVLRVTKHGENNWRLHNSCCFQNYFIFRNGGKESGGGEALLWKVLVKNLAALYIYFYITLSYHILQLKLVHKEIKA